MPISTQVFAMKKFANVVVIFISANIALVEEREKVKIIFTMTIHRLNIAL